MEVNPMLKKVIAIYNISQVIAIIVCVAVSVTSVLMFLLLPAILLVIVFIILVVASKCNFQDLVVILVHYNPILSTMCFLCVFPVCVCACILGGDYSIYRYIYGDGVDDRVILIAVMTGLLSIGSAIFAVMGIWKSARKVVLVARSSECDPVNAVGSVPPAYDAPVTFTDLNGIRIVQGFYGQPLLPR
ncbi:hypothetical protein ACJMK2_028396 [Sinanodonta woodiana]|uniref:Uncharacterized protein n=1 Tax=Sinanodonta woodiana TaxID=1069815 RepID=A0ABD3X8I0_SINWO